VAVSFFRDEFGLSERVACQLSSVSRSSFRRKCLREAADGPLRKRMLELAAQRPRFGHRRLGVLLRREGFEANRKRIYKVYKDLGRAVRRKTRKLVTQANRSPRVVPIAANLQWSMDVMRDTLSSRTVFRTLNIVDDATREPSDRGRHIVARPTCLSCSRSRRTSVAAGSACRRMRAGKATAGCSFRWLAPRRNP
jgi:putative transposase